MLPTNLNPNGSPNESTALFLTPNFGNFELEPIFHDISDRENSDSFDSKIKKLRVNLNASRFQSPKNKTLDRNNRNTSSNKTKNRKKVQISDNFSIKCSISLEKINIESLPKQKLENTAILKQDVAKKHVKGSIKKPNNTTTESLPQNKNPSKNLSKIDLLGSILADMNKENKSKTATKTTSVARSVSSPKHENRGILGETSDEYET